ncbi:MAG: 4Fe-4S ferredoxin, partial [Deltaproteobacteria bacterium]|nr:4Fe-4S ferredoxin [Deltaproteobacteria bacterium]
ACATNCPAEAISVLAGVGCAAAVISSALPWGASARRRTSDGAQKIVCC